MAKFNEKLQELGLTENEVSKSIKTKIKDYNQAFETYTEAGSSDETLRISLEKLDDKIVATIEKWFANKDVQAERMRAMREKREAKKNSGETPAKKPVKKEEIIEEEQEEGEEDDDYEEELARAEELRRQEFLRRKAAYQAQQQQLQEQQTAQPKKKSKAIWILAGVVAVVTLGAVILKDK
jgi:hypothetical protein